MCNLDKLVSVVGEVNPNCEVSISTKHRYSEKSTIILNGRIEFNPAINESDAFETMIHFDLHVRKLENGLYESGQNNPGHNKMTQIDSTPCAAISNMSIKVLAEKSLKGKDKMREQTISQKNRHA